MNKSTQMKAFEIFTHAKELDVFVPDIETIVQSEASMSCILINWVLEVNRSIS